jgi:ATP-dependent DNA helicase RecG
LRVGPNSQKLRRNEIIEFLKSEGKVRFEDMVSNRFLFDEHFDPTKLRDFLRRAGITAVLEPSATLVNLGVAERQEGKILVNNAGVLLFARNLADIYFHTVVTCALYKGIEKVNVLDRKDFNSDIVSSVENAMVFLKQHLRLAYEFTGATRRKEVPLCAKRSSTRSFTATTSSAAPT